MVAFPLVAVLLSVIVFGAVKFWSGVPKLHVGRSTALGGSAVTVQLSATEPVNEFPVTVISCVVDCPGAVMLIEAVPDAGEMLMPEPKVMVTLLDVCGAA